MRTRVRYVRLGDSVLRIELLRGTPPDNIIIATPRGVQLAASKGIGMMNNAIQKRDIATIKYNWKFDINENKEL